MKGELAELLDTLLDLQQSYPAANPSPTSADPNPTPADPTAAPADPTPADPTPAPAASLARKLSSLLPLLLASYGATLSSPDQSLLRALLHINDIIFHTDDYQRSVDAAAAVEGGQATAGVLMTDHQSPHPEEYQHVEGSLVTGGGEKDAGSGRRANGDGGIGAVAAEKAIPEGSERQGEGESEREKPDGPITSLLQGPLAKAGWVNILLALASIMHSLI